MIDPNKELFKWGPIDFKLFYGSLFNETLFLRGVKGYKWFWPPCLLLYIKGKVIFILDKLELQKTGLKYFNKYLLNLKNYQIHWNKYEEWIKEYEKAITEFDDLNKLNDEEFYKKFKYFYDLNIHFWLIVHVPEIANWGGEYLLENKLSRLDKAKSHKYLEILSASVKFSFFQKEELDLLRVGLTQGNAKQKEKLKEHAKKYHWILNSYGSNRILNEKYFTKKLNELKKEKSSLQEQIKEIKNIIKNHKVRQQRLIKKLELDKKLILISKQLSESIWWQDHRKGYIWRMHTYWDKFLRETAKRTKWTFNELLWCHAYEILRILRNSKNIKKKEILKRKEYYMCYAKNGTFKVFNDKKYVKNLEKIYMNLSHGENKEIKGLVVSKGNNNGKITGKVRIIKNPFKDNKKMQKGDILVAGMTSPEFIIVMRKAAAIITDQGGVTCHAAIVSRELKISCIVGTKIATKVLKDGDLVEIDANHGLVKIINQK